MMTGFAVFQKTCNGVSILFFVEIFDIVIGKHMPAAGADEFATFVRSGPAHTAQLVVAAGTQKVHVLFFGFTGIDHFHLLENKKLL